jgi:prepilin-type N-terminal cleavage/methylation domain-containing protein
MTKSSKSLFKRLRAFFKRSQKSGFTLLELLVAMFIAGLIIIGLLALSAQITEANQRDAGRSQIQQDMQSALDYIAQDLREAVFVYNGDCLNGNAQCPGLVNYLTPKMKDATKRTPVLAFWRTSPLPDKIRRLCGQDEATFKRMTDARVLCVAGASYTLVVYAIDTDTSTDIWKGKSRIVRYQLPQFLEDAKDETEQSAGYAPPSSSSFQVWPLETVGGVNTQLSTPSDSQYQPQVLVDFVDDGNTPDPDGRFAGKSPSCEGFGSTTDEQANSLSPKGTARTGFYVCVRNGGYVAPPLPGTPLADRPAVNNQDVQVVLTGSVAGYSGAFPKNAANDNELRLSPIQTRVLIRGVLNKG